MIQHHDEFLLARYPAVWGFAPYQMGDRVCVFDSSNPGTVTGLMFFQTPNHDGVSEGELGWWVQVELDESADRHFVEPVGIFQPRQIQPLLASVQPSYPELTSV